MEKNRILVLCNDFYPDSIIGAKRLSMFVYYLSRKYDITVIRSGDVIGKPSLRLNLHKLKNVSIISFKGKNSLANQLENGIVAPESIKKPHNKRAPLFKMFLYRFLKSFIFFRTNRIIKKKTIISINELIKSNKFDLVISTYSPLGSTAAAYYCKKKYGVKWIMDIRDIMDIPSRGWLVRLINHHLQKKYANFANMITTPTAGFKKELIERTDTKKDICVLYNGYDSTNIMPSTKTHKSPALLNFCYTGTIHDDSCTLEVFSKCINELVVENKIRPEDISISYAGSNSGLFLKQTKTLNKRIHINDYGYLNSEEIFAIQEESDIFLLMVMNQKKYTGVLTGKLAEGVQHKAFLLGMVFGDLPNSELAQIINKYSLGFCYEQTNNDSYLKMKEYILSLYQKKKAKPFKKLRTHISKEVEQVFDYEYICQALNYKIEAIINE